MDKNDRFVSTPVGLIIRLLFPKDGQEKDEFMALSDFGKELYLRVMLEHPDWNHKQRITYAVVLSYAPVVY